MITAEKFYAPPPLFWTFNHLRKITGVSELSIKFSYKLQALVNLGKFSEYSITWITGQLKFCAILDRDE